MFKKEFKIMNTFAEIIYLVLIFFFCYTASNKVMNIDDFRINLLKTSVFNSFYAYFFSILIIILEFLIVIILLIDKVKGIIIFGFTILIFTLYISYLRYNGLYEVCGCGGILNGLSYESHFLINILLIFGSLFCFYQFYIAKNEK